MPVYRHFILTRFNIRLWSKDKRGQSTQTDEWLKERFELFERFCFPSINNQTRKDFKWIVLFDADTPTFYKEKIKRYEKECEQFVPCFVAAEEGRYFVRIFKKHIVQEIEKGDILITTYLDNDDALHYDYTEEVYQLATTVRSKTFISFVYGLQYFTELNIATRVPFRNNHFISFVEEYIDRFEIKTVFGYGGHIRIDTYAGTETLYVENSGSDKWIEVVHKSNMDNDVKMTFDTHLITDSDKLRREYGIPIQLAKNSRRIYYTHFLARAIAEVVRHVRLRFVGRKWN